MNNVRLGERDHAQISRLVQMVASDADFRARFCTDAEGALQSCGLKLSPEAASVVATNAQEAARVTERMDAVSGAFFFFLIAVAPSNTPMRCN